MKAKLKPASAKARALFEKLRALTERGIDGEKVAAREKLARLEARFDFGNPDPDQAPDLFRGNFKRASKARFVRSFRGDELHIANAVKWAIESATKIPCVYRDGELMAEATAATASRLTQVADHIARSFSALVERFGAIDGVSVSDRSVFVMGLYDGMMNEIRSVGQPLPSRPTRMKTRRGRKPSSPAATLHVHPYTLAVDLGRKIRFSAPVEEIAAELAAATRRCLAVE